MVCVEIPDRRALNSGSRGCWLRLGSSQRIERCDRNIAEITEPHRPLAHGVMTRRAHQTEGPFAAEGCASRFNGCAS
jgi:hypothetical protein